MCQDITERINFFLLIYTIVIKGLQRICANYCCYKYFITLVIHSVVCCSYKNRFVIKKKSSPIKLGLNINNTIDICVVQHSRSKFN